MTRKRQKCSPCESLVWKISSVEDIVLKHEEDVKEDGEEAEAELGWIAKDARPVVVVVSDQDHLQVAIEAFYPPPSDQDHHNHDYHHDLYDGKTSASEVEEDIADAPAYCAFPSEVHVRLRNIPAIKDYHQVDLSPTL